jgi:hypothetical protein
MILKETGVNKNHPPGNKQNPRGGYIFRIEIT